MNADLESYAAQLETAVRILGGDRRSALTQLRSMERDAGKCAIIDDRIRESDTPASVMPDFAGRSKQPIKDALLYETLVLGDASKFRRLVIGAWQMSPDHVVAWLDQWGLEAHPMIQGLIDRSMNGTPEPGTRI